jgi:HEAT repeat protein
VTRVGLKKPVDFFLTIVLAAPGVQATPKIDEDQRSAILKSLTSEDTGARRQALRVLIKVPDAWFLPPLIHLARTEKDLQTRRYVLSALANLGPKAKAAISAIVPLMKTEAEQGSPSWDFPAAGVFISIGAGAVPAMTEIVENPANTPVFRYSAVCVLEQIANKAPRDAKAAVPCLIGTLKEEDAKLREASARALKAIGPDARAAVPILSTYLKNGNGIDSVCAAETLYRLDPGNKLIVPALIKGLGAEDHARRAHAAQVVREVSPKNAAIVKALIVLLRDRDPNVRCNGASALGRLGPFASEATQALSVLLNDEDSTVRYTAREALKAIRSKDIQ